MEVQETNITTRMKSFHRVTTKHESYYPHAEGISQNGCNSTSRHDFLLKFSVNTQNKILFSEKNRPSVCLDFLLFQKKNWGGGGFLAPIQNRVKKMYITFVHK